jgi:outer membrane receptor protein involved in Fe transport
MEISASKDYDFNDLSMRLSGNASFFDTEIDIFSDSGNLTKTRQLQGQPDVLFNAQAAFDEYESGREYTLVINHTGESLHAVSANPLLGDEMKLARTVLDFNFKQPLMVDDLDFKVAIKNILNAEVEQQQSGLMTKKYKPGVEFKMGVSYVF